MARIRSIKPEFWDDRKLAKRTSRDARLLYIALWNLADEHGRVNGDPQWIKGQVFSYDDDIDAAVIAKLLDELAAPSLGAVVRYEADEDPYLFLPKLARHQRLEPEKVKSRLPEPPDDPSGGPDNPPPAAVQSVPDAYETESGAGQSESRAEESARRAAEAAQRAGKPALLYGAGSMGQVAGSRGAARRPDGASRDSPPPTADAKGLHEIPDDFTATDAMRRWANRTYPGLDLDFETVQFCRHWRSEGRRKKNWAEAWEKWIGDSHRRMTPRASPPGDRNQQNTNGLFDRAMQRAEEREQAS